MENRKLLVPGNPEDAKRYFKDKICLTTGPAEVKSFRESGEDFVLVDVRAAEDFAKGHPPGAVSLPRDQWDTYAGLQKDKVNILFCYSEVCHLAAKAALKFATKGYPVMEMDGGFEAWQENELDTEKGGGSRMGSQSQKAFSR